MEKKQQTDRNYFLFEEHLQAPACCHPQTLWWQCVKLLKTDLEHFHCSVYQPQLFFSSSFCLMSNINVVSVLISSNSSKSAEISQALGRKCSLKLSITQSQRPVWLFGSSFRSVCEPTAQTSVIVCGCCGRRRRCRSRLSELTRRQRWKGRAEAGIVGPWCLWWRAAGCWRV